MLCPLRLDGAPPNRMRRGGLWIASQDSRAEDPARTRWYHVRPSRAPQDDESNEKRQKQQQQLQTFRSGPMRYRMEAAHWFTERGFGKPPQTVELTAEDGGPVSVTIRWPESD